jgi:hypothetical protein
MKIARKAHFYEQGLSSDRSAFSGCFLSNSSYLNSIDRKGLSLRGLWEKV